MISKEMRNVIDAAHVVAAANSRYIRGVEHHSSCEIWETRGAPTAVSPACTCGATDFSEALQLLAKVCKAERGGTEWFATQEELQTEMERIEQS